MARRVAAFALAAVLVTVAWLRLERGDVPLLDVATILALAVLPGLARLLGRGRGRTGLVLFGAAIVSASVATKVPLADAQPRDPERDFFGPVLAKFREGTLAFWDTALPFNPFNFPLMHGVVLLAIFGFVAVAGVVLAEGKSTLAAAVLVVGVGWPSTLAVGERPLVVGAAGLLGILALLFLLGEDGGRRTRRTAHAVGAGVLLALVAVTASGSEAVAKGAFVGWQDWDPYDKPVEPVSVRYVWDANYAGIAFPKEKTVVLKVRVPGPKRSLYWRATTLDVYTGSAWREVLTTGAPRGGGVIDVIGEDALLPEAAKNEKDWVRQDVTVEALADRHLIASAQPVRWEPGTDAPVQLADGGVAVVPDELRQGQRYRAWSYVPIARPKRLAKIPGSYRPELDRYLRIGDWATFPQFADGGREAKVEKIFADEVGGPASIGLYEDVYVQARRVTRAAKSPYAAAVALETWFRRTGGFRYVEQPGVVAGVPPLVNFILSDKRGYCQHFAGGMALMLRLLGIPSRVAAGFTSGKYDTRRGEWTVTDHNAHTWVEVWFPDFGWLPFDPTPGRGRLDTEYSLFSPSSDGAEAAGALGAALWRGIQGESIKSSRPGQEAAGGFGRGNGNSGETRSTSDRGQSLVAVALIVLAVGAGGLVAIKAARRRLRFLTRDPRRVAAACRRDLVGFLADQGVEAPPSLTLGELGALVEREFVVNARPLVAALASARFGPPTLVERASRRARRELRALRREIVGQLGYARRIRGALSLRSLAV